MTFLKHPAPIIALCVSLTSPALAQENVQTTGVDISDSDPVSADLYVEGNTVLDDSVCIGNGCSDEIDFSVQTLAKFRDSNLWLEFEDTSTVSMVPSNDWRLRVNDTGSGGLDRFSIEDVTGGTIPFTLEAGAPENALYIDDDGELGIGTSLPTTQIDMRKEGSTTLKMSALSGGLVATAFGISVNSVGFEIIDLNNTVSTPFSIRKDVPQNTLVLASSGNVGLGTVTPDAPLEISQDETFSFFRLTAENAAVNTGVDIVFTEGPLGTGQLRYNIVEGIGVQTPEMTLDADGNMVLTGMLTTMGPTCAGGCDRVFDADYALLSIEDHAEQMFSFNHLPAIGPTLPQQPVNVTQKLGSVINELEHAHVYISQLNAELSELRQKQSKANALLRDEIAHLRGELNQLKAP